MGATRILIADDDPDLRFTLGAQLEADGYEVQLAPNGQTALTVAERVLPHLAVVDLVMPVMDGFELARRLRRLGDVPIIMLTALDDEESKVKGLEQYADDYVTKPFSYRELHARIKRVLERAWLPGPGTGPEPEVLALEDGLRIDFARRQVLRPGEDPVRLTPTEVRLLRLLARNRGQILPNGLLLDRAWPDGGGSPPALWEYVRRLRQKLGDEPDSPRYLESERGIGYRLRLPPG
ncbi:MAG TPA: response regulator transcription factor [Chloroflexota bacterium]|nr:response regulator transcription factor [Chloroflexota bacterium]